MSNGKYHKWHIVMRPTCGIRSFEIRLLCDYLTPLCDKLLVCYEEVAGVQTGHLDICCVLSQYNAKKKANFKRSIMRAVYKRREPSDCSPGLYLRYLMPDEPKMWEYIVGYSRKDKRPIVARKNITDEEIAEAQKYFRINLLEMLKKKKFIGCMQLTRKNWDIVVRDYWDRNPGRYNTVMDCVKDMMATGRYVCTFASHRARWKLLEHYCYGTDVDHDLLTDTFELGWDAHMDSYSVDKKW